MSKHCPIPAFTAQHRNPIQLSETSEEVHGVVERIRWILYVFILDD